MEKEVNDSRVQCTQCTNRILEATSIRNAGLCGICNNWNYPESQRNQRNIKNARKSVGYARIVATIALTLLLATFFISLSYIEFSLTTSSLISWFFILMFATFLFCSFLHLLQWAKKRAHSTDQQIFDELKLNYLKQTKKARKIAAAYSPNSDKRYK